MASQNVPGFSYARYAEMLGFKGIRVDASDQVPDAWEKALAADRLVLSEAVTNPEVPPLPPHISLEQAKLISQALVKGDPNAVRIVKQSIKSKLQEFTTR